MKPNVEIPKIEVLKDMTCFDFIKKVTNNKEQEEPFFVADASDIVRKFKLWRLKLPRVEVFYAIKCNDDPTIIRLLAAMGVGFDCASKVEIQTVMNIGVHPSRIIYANPCKTKSFVKYAADVGVDMMTFDNEIELHKIKRLHPRAKLVIRIRVDDSSSIFQLGLKFGCKLSDVPHLLQVAKELNLDVIGVSFHVGSQCRNKSSYQTAVKWSRQVMEIAESIGYHMDLLDIGGGFPGSKAPHISFEEIAGVLNEALDEYFPPDCGVRIIAEPGRYFVSSAFTLCANIIAKKEAVANNGETLNKYYLNDGLYGSFNCLIFDHAEVEPIPLVDLRYRQMTKSSIWGPTSDTKDCISKECTMPTMNIGEWIMFENMGDYTTTSSSNFNGFAIPETKWVLSAHILTYLKKFPNWADLQILFGNQV